MQYSNYFTLDLCDCAVVIPLSGEQCDLVTFNHDLVKYCDVTGIGFAFQPFTVIIATGCSYACAALAIPFDSGTAQPVLLDTF